MKCRICDQEDPFINFDETTKEFTDCSECQSIIQDTLLEFEDSDIIES